MVEKIALSPDISPPSEHSVQDQELDTSDQIITAKSNAFTRINDMCFIGFM